MEFQKELSGTWKIFAKGGGNSGFDIETTYDYLRLKNNKHYFIFHGDTLKASGNFSVYDSGYDNSIYFESYFVKFNKGIDYDSKLRFPIDRNLDVTLVHSDTLIFSWRRIADGDQYIFIRAK
jgi:hypothetical protein